MRDNATLIMDGINWHQSHAASFDPSNNSLKTDDGETITYDYLVVGTGI